MNLLKRREVIAWLATGAGSRSPLRAQPERTAAIGVLATGNPSPEAMINGLREALAGLGHVNGQNLRVEIRSAQGDAARLPGLATELVRMKVDVIVAYLTPSATAAKQATSDIPIVMFGVGDPVGTGLIASLARPGGNITGISSAAAETAGKNVELIHEMLPAARRLTVLANETDFFVKPMMAEIELAGTSFGLEIQPIMMRQGQAFEGAFAMMRQNGSDAVFVQPSILRHDVVDLALKERLPSFSISRLLPASGGLASYSSNYAELYRESAVYVDKILKGRRPADLPVALATKFDLVINLKTAKALDLTIPLSLLARADEVIE